MYHVKICLHINSVYADTEPPSVCFNISIVESTIIIININSQH